MKNLNLKLYLVAFFALIVLFSCENETVDNVLQQQEIIEPNSTLVQIMQTTTANDGSVDDILDDANCISVNLPVTIQIDGATLTIETLQGLSQIEEIYNEFDDDVDDLDFVFPITITLNDYTQIVIEDEDELENFVEACTDENPVNECVDFQYPITFSIYNTDFQIINTVTLQSDFELYVFLENLENESEGGVLASLNFPITMVYLNGDTVEVNSNQELQNVIEEAEEFCDDDDEDDCSEQEIEEDLMECSWQIVAYNGDDNFLPYHLNFVAGGDLQITGGNFNESLLGSWSMATTNQGLVLTLSELANFSDDLEGEWLVVDCDDDRLELIRENENSSVQIVMEQECDDDDDCDQEEVRNDLIECHWYLGTNLYDNIIGEQFYFLNSNELLVVNPESNEENTGTWDIATIDGELTIFFNINEPYGAISNSWVVIECDDDRVKMINGDDYLVFEQSCENNPLECFSDIELEICDNIEPYNDGIAEFSLYDVYPNCTTNDVEITFYQSLTNAEVQVNTLNADGYVNVSNPQTIYARVDVIATGNFEIYAVELIVENCEQTCSETQIDDFLMTEECVWNVVNFNGDDHLIDYNLSFENTELLFIYDGEGFSLDASWATSQSEEGVVVEFSNVEAPNIQAISGEWLVVECEDDRLELYNDNDIMVLERSCD